MTKQYRHEQCAVHSWHCCPNKGRCEHRNSWIFTIVQFDVLYSDLYSEITVLLFAFFLGIISFFGCFQHTYDANLLNCLLWLAIISRMLFVPLPIYLCCACNNKEPFFKCHIYIILFLYNVNHLHPCLVKKASYIPDEDYIKKWGDI